MIVSEIQIQGLTSPPFQPGWHVMVSNCVMVSHLIFYKDPVQLSSLIHYHTFASDKVVIQSNVKNQIVLSIVMTDNKASFGH